MGRRLYVGLKLLPQLKAADDARLQVLIWGDLGRQTAFEYALRGGSISAKLNSAQLWEKGNYDCRSGTGFPNGHPNGSAGHSLESRWLGRQTAFEYSCVCLIHLY